MADEASSVNANADNAKASDASISRFQSQGYTAEDILKQQTVGLVHLSDFRKRRVEAIGQSERGSTRSLSGNVTPDSRESDLPPTFKKKKKMSSTGKKGALSFDDEDDELSNDNSPKPGPNETDDASGTNTSDADANIRSQAKRRMRANHAHRFQPKAMTKSALAREEQIKEQLRQDYMRIQEAVKQTEIAIPFCFFDGRNAPGGTCRMKKGDQVWLFLERARKLGAGLAGKGDKTKKDWARISVDDLMLVKGDLIIPHHYEFYYFILERSKGYQGVLFDYDSQPTKHTSQKLLEPDQSQSRDVEERGPDAESMLMTAAQRKQQVVEDAIPESELEGFNLDPSATRVVDRRWYEKNKHIYPASMWEDFDPARDYTSGVRKDPQGNAIFFSR